VVDYRSREEKRAAQRLLDKENARALAVQKDYQTALAKMNATVANRLEELENKTQVIAGTVSETRQQLDQQVTALNDDISKVHAMIRAGAESDMQAIEQMNRNNENRMSAILQLIKDM